MDSSSDLTFSSDWDIIDDEMSQLVGSRKKSEDATSEDLKENLQKGSCVNDIIPEQEVNDAQDGSNVVSTLDVTGSENNNQQESSSSSEFDVLDEAVEDNQSNLSFSHMEYSISSSLESSHPSLLPEAEVEADPKDETPLLKPSQEYSLNVHPYLVAITLSLAFIAILVASAPFGSIQQMKERLNALQTENTELKNLVQSKLENDKILIALEEQIKSLKDENYKLSDSMKALVDQLEVQTIILKKDKENKVQDPYRNEIEKLKEQINILQIDNEELQKQLVRTRYGIYSPYPKESEANPAVEEKEESKDKTDNKENRDNSSEFLMEEISELKKKLYAEVEKLKNWKDSVQHLVKKLGNGFTGSSADNREENSKSKKPSSEKIKTTKPGKDKKNSDWTWGGVKKNFEEKFGLRDIEVPKVISHYVNRRKIEGVFESVNHYFKKAQEKAKKMLDFKSDANEEMWDFLGQVRNHWQDVKNKYFQKHYHEQKQAHPKTEDNKPQNHEHKPKMPDREDAKDFESDKKFVQDVKTEEKFTQDVKTDKKFTQDVKTEEKFTQDVKSDKKFTQDAKSDKKFTEDFETDKNFAQDLKTDQKFKRYSQAEINRDFEMYKKVNGYETVDDLPEEVPLPYVTPEYVRKNLDNLRESILEWTYAYRKYKMEEEEKAKKQENSWIFNRAAQRSQLREEEQESFINWYLKRGHIRFSEDETLQKWFKDNYQNENSDEEQRK